MSTTPRLTRAAMALLAIMAVLLLPSAAGARSTTLQGAELVNVSVTFNTQVPLADLSDETLASSQKSGRKFIYRMARDECQVLKAIIAASCRLTNLSVNAQVRQQGNPSTILLHINGSANFSITLKDEDGD